MKKTTRIPRKRRGAAELPITKRHRRNLVLTIQDYKGIVKGRGEAYLKQLLIQSSAKRKIGRLRTTLRKTGTTKVIPLVECEGDRFPRSVENELRLQGIIFAFFSLNESNTHGIYVLYYPTKNGGNNNDEEGE